jgi:hypothetical protein
VEICPEFEEVNLSDSFPAERELCKIDPLWNKWPAILLHNLHWMLTTQKTTEFTLLEQLYSGLPDGLFSNQKSKFG